MIRFAPIVVAVAATALLGSAAYAHPKLASSTPAANATVASPARITLRFSEKLVDKFSGADLVMTDMPGMKMNSPMKIAVKTMTGPDGKTLTLMPAKPLTAGGYKLDYHVVSADTHRINGGFNFRVK